MTDKIASISPLPLPKAAAPDHVPPGTPGLEDDSLEDGGPFWSTDEGPTFAEFLDMINPLHHIPVVSTIYRAITGDEIGTGPRVIGGLLFGGPFGAIAAGVAAMFEEASGGSIATHIAELIDGDDTEEVMAAKPTEPATATPQQAAMPTPVGPNHISLNPAAALGVPQVAQGSLAKAAHAFPARSMAMPFGTAAQKNAVPSTPVHADAQRVQASLTRSRRQQADLLMAQWAAQQMESQKQPGAASGRQARDGTDGKDARTVLSEAPVAGSAQPTAAHPMLPPRNASPEWYAQAMDRALNQYRGGMNAQAATPAALSIRR